MKHTYFNYEGKFVEEKCVLLSHITRTNDTIHNNDNILGIPNLRPYSNAQTLSLLLEGPTKLRESVCVF